MKTGGQDVNSKRKRRTGRRKRVRFSLRTYVILAGVIVLGCFLLSAGWNAEGAAGLPSAASNQLKKTSHALSVPASTKDTSKKEASSKQKSTPSVDDWHLILVNPWHTIPENYQVTLTQLQNGQAVDERCYPDLQKMMDDCRAEGLSPIICSSYRTQQKQETLFRNQYNRLIAQGYSQEKAQAETSKAIATPGTSEHQLGLAVDIVDRANQNLDQSQETTAVQRWLMANSWKYGFILRYPNEKSDITGIIYEPWHYRYVGKDAAKEIYEQNICLEEYLEQLVK